MEPHFPSNPCHKLQSKSTGPSFWRSRTIKLWVRSLHLLWMDEMSPLGVRNAACRSKQATWCQSSTSCLSFSFSFLREYFLHDGLKFGFFILSLSVRFLCLSYVTQIHFRFEKLEIIFIVENLSVQENWLKSSLLPHNEPYSLFTTECFSSPNIIFKPLIIYYVNSNLYITILQRRLPFPPFKSVPCRC